MIRVSIEGIALSGGFFEWNGSPVLSVGVNGHSDFSVKGSDIVCAAVSALVQAASRSIAAKGIHQTITRSDGFLSFSLEWEALKDAERRFTVSAIDVMLFGLLAVAESHPENVNIIFLE